MVYHRAAWSASTSNSRCRARSCATWAIRIVSAVSSEINAEWAPSLPPVAAARGCGRSVSQFLPGPPWQLRSGMFRCQCCDRDQREFAVFPRGFAMGAALLARGPCGIPILSALKDIPARLLRITTQAIGACHQRVEYSVQFCQRLSHAYKMAQLGQGCCSPDGAVSSRRVRSAAAAAEGSAFRSVATLLRYAWLRRRLAARWRPRRFHREQRARVTSGFCTSGPKGSVSRQPLHGNATCRPPAQARGKLP